MASGPVGVQSFSGGKDPISVKLLLSSINLDFLTPPF